MLQAHIGTALVVAGQCSVCWFSQSCPCVLLARKRALPSAGEYLSINDRDNLAFWFFDYGSGLWACLEMKPATGAAEEQVVCEL